ncbi:MAG: carboxymuconolactone decarboxylase family protein [Bacteroidetes bacterium]|nr:carboxymuconolactone decarboxylase family protein [Bacteroidota bacterium]MBS1540842.1 carboxymuconolactone decarboxylase family protein [Bacteroidota bacterium]
MKQRLNVKQLEPKAYEILITMEKYLAATGLPVRLQKLIKIRASQINKCAYCLEMHTIEARAAGETEQRMHALAAWEESPYFTEAERAVLSFAEEVTKIAEHGVSDAVFQNMQAHYTDNQIAQIIILINQINFWNRIAVSTKQLYQAP